MKASSSFKNAVSAVALSAGLAMTGTVAVQLAAMEAAEAIASKSLPIAMMTKESINRAFEIGLSEGIRFERRAFHALFATEDQKEGMSAFLEKRQPQFRDK